MIMSFVTINHTVTGASEYDGIGADSVTVRVQDNDTPGVQVSKVALTVFEGGASDSYTLKLNTQPSATTTISLRKSGDSVNDVNDFMLSATTFVFTRDNWNTTQTVTASAKDDEDAVNETITIRHSLAGATEYRGRSVNNVSVTAEDDETAGATFSTRSLQLGEGETAGKEYTVKLNARPSGNVTVRITDDGDVTVNPTNLYFNNNSWSNEQRVTVKPVGDHDSDDEDVEISHEFTGANEYAALPDESVFVRLIDNDTPGLTISRTEMSLNEGRSNSYTIKLNTQPSDNVRVTINPDNEKVSLSTTTLTFTSSNWSRTQNIRVTAAQDDDAINATTTISHVASGATEYSGETGEDVVVSIDDDETTGVTITPTSLSLTEDSATDREKTYTVKLDSEPSAPVTITTSTSGDGADVISVSGPPLVFNLSNWSQAQTTTVSALTDDDGDDEAATISHEVRGGDYIDVTASDVTVNVTDDDDPIVRVSFEQATYTVAEGRSVSIKISLDAQPERPLNIPIQASNQGLTSATDYSVPTTVAFTSSQTERTISFSATQDSIDDDGESVMLNFNVGSLPRVVLGANTPATFHITDDDGRGVTISPTTLNVNEGQTRKLHR